MPLAQIAPSPTNPRKRFDKAQLDELAESIRKHDVLQPILLRPNGERDLYEIVAGERRFRAAKAAGLADIPATVRTLTDAEVLEIQVVENLQRSDLHELEEAEGYEQLLKCKHPGGERYTVDEIAAKVGKSRSYVFARLKLCALCPEAKKAFYAGDLDASRALLIARIAHHDTQRQALKDVTGTGEWSRGPMSYREAHEHVLRSYMLQLKGAPFDVKDERLLPKAGACGPCAKRTGNQADLFGDVKNADVCTDPRCFDDKRRAHYGVAAKKLEAEGFEVIRGDAAKKIIPHWEHGGSYYSLNGGYEKFEGTTYASGRSQKISSLFPKDFKPKKLQHPLTGEIIDVVTSQAIAAAARKRAKDAPARKASGGATRQHREQKKGPEEILEERVYLEIFRKLPSQPGRLELQLLAEDALNAMDLNVAVIGDELTPRKDGKKHDWRSGNDALKKALPKMEPGDLARIAVAVAIASKAHNLKTLAEYAKRYKVDLAKVKQQIADEEKAAATKAPEAKAATKKNSAAKPKKRGLAALGIEVAARAEQKPARTPLIKPMTDADVKKPAKKAKKPAKSARSPTGDFMKPMTPSAELAVVVGATPMPRTEVTAKLWGYIKKNNLQDKVNRRMINLDEKLRPILGDKAQISMFQMTQLVAKHLS